MLWLGMVPLSRIAVRADVLERLLTRIATCKPDERIAEIALLLGVSQEIATQLAQELSPKKKEATSQTLASPKRIADCERACVTPCTLRSQKSPAALRLGCRSREKYDSTERCGLHSWVCRLFCGIYRA